MTGTSSARAAFGEVIAAAARQALVWDLLCGVTGSLLLWAGARWVTPATIDGPVADPGWTGRTRAWFTSRGFQVPRLKVGSGREFSWTIARARIAVPNLNRADASRLSFDVSSYRPGAIPLPSITMAIDTDVRATLQTTADRQWMTSDVLPRSERGLVVMIEPSSTFEFLSALVGLVRRLRERPREGLTLVLLAWSVVWAGASALGILTSVELRANLASAPMFVFSPVTACGG